MRRSLLGGLALALPLGLLAQQLAHEASVINIEVPVRVYRDGRFVDDLTLADFEIIEEGVPQPPLAAYLVRKTAVAKKDERGRAFQPRVDKRSHRHPPGRLRRGLMTRKERRACPNR
jgi:hypothetical protein